VRHVGKVGLVAKQMVTDLHSGQLPLGEDPICHSHQELTTLVKHGGALGVRPSGGIQRLMPQVGRLAKLPVYFGSVDDASPHGRIQLGGVVCDVIHHGQALGPGQDHRDVVVVAEPYGHCLIISVDQRVVAADADQIVFFKCRSLDNLPRRFKPTSRPSVCVRVRVLQSF